MIMRRWSECLLLFLLTMLPVAGHGGIDAGISAYDRGDFAGAFREFSEAGKKGDAEAQFRLGLMYRAGKGVVRIRVQQACSPLKVVGVPIDPGTVPSAGLSVPGSMLSIPLAG